MKVGLGGVAYDYWTLMNEIRFSILVKSYPEKYNISVFCRELPKIKIYSLSWTISNKKILVTDKKYFLEACI